MFKRVAQNPAIPWLGGTLIWAYMRVIAATLRWRVEGLERLQNYWEGPQPFVMAAWHSRMALMPFIVLKGVRKWSAPPHPLALMVSASRDGEFTRRACSMMGLHIIRGSAARKGKKKGKRSVSAAREAMDVMNKGGGLIVTIDGPSGPPEVVGIGTIKLAQQMNAPIFVYGLSSGGRRLKSWDRLILPPPFARGAVVIGEPINTSKDMDSETLRAEVEASLKEVTSRADHLAGRKAESQAAPQHATQSQDNARQLERGGP